MQQKNLILFFALALVIMICYAQLRQLLWAPPKLPEKPAAELTEGNDGHEADGAGPAPAVRGDATRLAMGPLGELALRRRPVARPHLPTPTAAPPTEPSKLIHLGGRADEKASRFHLDANLDPRGAGVRSVVLNKFEQATREGRPDWKNKDANEVKRLELLPADSNRDIPAFALYDYDPRDATDEHPLDTLGRVVWSVVGDKDNPVAEERLTDGRLRQSVSFRTESQGVTITKTFSLTEGDYHLGLEVKMSKRDGSDTKEQPFRYQLAGGRGLPIEGEWYTNTFRNALIARVEHGNVYRDVQDLRQIAVWEGGNDVVRDKDMILEYAGVAVQYFSSVIVVDDDQKRTDFLLKARPTLENALTKGRLKSISPEKDSLVLSLGERGDETFYVPPKSEARTKIDLTLVREGQPVAVVYGSDGVTEDGKLRAVATDIMPQALAQPMFIDDITVRVSTEAVDLKPGIEVVHKYVLYNGPVKPMLLGQLTGDAAVPPEVVNRYLYKLHLDTLTDYHSPGPVGRFASSIYWTQIIIKCTNLMHGVLNWLHKWIPNYGICIIVLTVLVRGAMFPVSRKQALTSMRMQELAPELKKLQEKYKEDKQTLGREQMELYRKHNVNPFGSCWFLLLQMPVFMGLYYCLQESIFFRLAPFWPSWIINLAAPDMLYKWGENIPFISRPEDYGSMFYLGPYFNLLPVIAVTLMIFQQKFTMPPPTDEQQEMQQKMMKYMMIFFGLMFYKVAAGLCVYFISSSMWGFAERKLLPKKKQQPPPTGQASSESLLQRILKRAESGSSPPAGTSSSTGITNYPASGIVTSGSQESRPNGKRKKGKRRREDGVRGGSDQDRSTPDGVRGWWQVRRERLAAWWQELLRQAEKKR
jgi:YidC/Oxa1 family membrane protein insertase